MTLNKDFMAHVFKAVEEKNKSKLERLFKLDANVFLQCTHALVANGFIQETSPQNLIPGGDSELPIDLHSPSAFELTTKGRLLLQMKRR
ncbi:hypothetical protein PaeCFBP13512_19780 [Paenibacillus sp. CFBP13512]|uniref:hypothetical protein n=1 Tax=Paenibacillus sp. CFBP13512 TaxID=2184007 RepID=UPI0010BFF02F|nr:hypothetical protein [Paenibacillus sp. CFBP13512]TKJ86076.1 hypothetical protein PaeCFBP13512_19780 [Paenibacillus sp. CFBP13512]